MDVAANEGTASKGFAVGGAELEGGVLGGEKLAFVLRGLPIISVNPSSEGAGVLPRDCRLFAVVMGLRLGESLPRTVSASRPIWEKRQR